MGALTLKLDRQNDQTRVRLAGEITEESDFSSLLADEHQALVIDLGDVERINSCGVREWINFVSELSRSGKRLVLERCSPPIVQQLNMISNFVGSGEVASVFAPYFCGACGADATKLLSIESGRPPPIDESMPCPQCNGQMEFDDLPDIYLAFLG